MCIYPVKSDKKVQNPKRSVIKLYLFFFVTKII